MLDWWKNLSNREQMMVGLALVIAGLLGIYQFIWTPLAGWHDANLRRVDRERLNYELVIRAAALHGTQQTTSTAPQSRPADMTTPLKSALLASVSGAGLKVSTHSGNDDTRVEMRLDPSDPEQLYDWLALVEAQYGAVIREAQISRARTDNLVNVDLLVFTRKTRQAGT